MLPQTSPFPPPRLGSTIAADDGRLGTPPSNEEKVGGPVQASPRNPEPPPGSIGTLVAGATSRRSRLRRSKNVMARACKASGIPHFHPHDLRHRYASLKIREGVPVTELAAQLGTRRRALRSTRTRHVLIDMPNHLGHLLTL